MTVEHLFVAEIVDIQTIRLTCRNCNGATVMSPDIETKPSYNCAQCGAELISKTDGSREYAALRSLLNSIREARRMFKDSKLAVGMIFPADK